MFKRPILKYRIPRNNRKLSTLRNSVPFSQARAVGILFSAGSIEKHNAIKKLIADLESAGKKVEVLTYLGKGRENHEFLFNYFTKKDFNMWGNIENQHIEHFVNEAFDFLYCLDTDLNLFLKYILTKNKAKCRIGPLGKGNDLYYELMVKPTTENIEGLTDSMWHYTKQIN